MKVEQACRFRLDEGYCIFAKSEGLRPAQEEALSDAFNSTMNTIFPKPGASVLSCIPGKSEAFLARNTLRTDILGRKTIFTHAYIFDADEYAKCMEETPELVLSISMEQLLDSQTPGAHMEQLELTAPAADEMLLENLFQKYNLTPVRYGKLLMGAYEALTSNASLRLKTNLPLEKTEQMVREMTYCILDGLLPILRGRVSFSSGADTRMSISVSPNGDAEIKSSDIIFGVEDDRYTNIRPKDEVSALAFEALGKASHTERNRVLQDMQFWLNEVVNVQEGLSVMLVSAAYCMSSGQTLPQNTVLMLFRSISTAKGFSPYVANGLLTSLVKQMNDSGMCSSKALSQIAGWYLRDSTPAYREEANRAFDAAQMDVCVALTQAVLEQSMTDRVREMLHVLLKRIPPESGMLPAETQNKVVLWILGENVEDLSHYAATIVMNYRNNQVLQLVRGILNGSKDRPLTGAEDIMLSKTLRRLTEAGICMSDEECEILDNSSSSYSEALMDSAMHYLFSVRIPNKETAEGLALLESISVRQPQYFVTIYKALHSGEANCGEVWEHYQAKHCFRSGMTLLEIQNACRVNNKFNNPCGVFEQRAASCLLSLVKEDYIKNQERAQIQYYVSVLFDRWGEIASNLYVSEGMKQTIYRNIIISFWKSVTYSLIFNNEYIIPEKYQIVTSEARNKLELYKLCINLRRNPTDTGTLIRLIQSERTDSEYRKILKGCAVRLFDVFLEDRRYLSWDLALIRCWESTEKGSDFNLDEFVSFCNKKDNHIRKQKIKYQADVSDSLLLQDERLAKSICKLGGDLPDIIKRLIVQLKAGKKGLLHNIFGGSSSREKRSSDTHSFGQHTSEKNRDSRISHVFDPTDVYYDD